MRKLTLSTVSLPALAACLLAGGISAPAGASSLARPADPVVLRGAQLQFPLRGAPPVDLVAFRFDGGWIQIPVQVDERDIKDFGDIYGPAADWGTGVALEQYADEGTFTGPDSDPALDDDDEIAFMAADAGSRPPTYAEPSGVLAESGVEVLLYDPLDGGLGYVYLFLQTGGLDPGAGQQYVDYRFDLLSGDYKSTYLTRGGPGTSHGPQANPEDSLIASPFYERHFSWRWTNDDLRILAGSSTGVDILEKRDYWIAPGSCGRHNATFNAGEGAFVANRSGPVRAIRSYLGANSGPLTQTTHLYYERREDVITALRVHPRSATGILYHDYNGDAFGMTYANNNNPVGVTIDGVPDTVVAGPLSWEMVTGPQGSMVVTHDTLSDIPGIEDGASSYYADKMNTSVNICQECEEAPTEACPGVVTISDPHLIGASGPFGTTPLPTTDPRDDPFYHLEGRSSFYYEAPGLTAADAQLRRDWVNQPLVTMVSRPTWVGDACDDGIDNDGDGFTDHPDDPGCANASDASERNLSLVCDDGLDNDHDGSIDFPGDPGCAGATGTLENPPCSDGLDNDGDGWIDHPDDPECPTPSGMSEFPSFVVSCGLGAELALALAPLLLLAKRRTRGPAPDARGARR
jgi:hypothetical protein